MLDPISDEAFEREEYHNQQLHWRKALEFQRELAQRLAVPCKETKVLRRAANSRGAQARGIDKRE